jgi:hypothetical protein
MEVTVGMKKALLEALIDKMSDDADKDRLKTKFKPLAILDNYPTLKKVDQEFEVELQRLNEQLDELHEKAKRLKGKLWDDLVDAMKQEKLVGDEITNKNTEFKIEV